LLTAIVMQQLERRQDAELVAHVQHARRALAAGHYVEPPGENVRDLVTTGLARWPDESHLLKLRSDAAHELVTRAMAARSGGDVAGARELATTAHELDPSDGTAKLLLAQYEDELAASLEDAGNLGGPRVTLEVPIGRARPGERSELVARVLVGSGRHEITRAQFVVIGPGLVPEGIAIGAVGSGRFRAIFSPPREGEYEVQFEANVDGATVRAHRTLTVTR
jgi:serine/threonine-protein kinase